MRYVDPTGAAPESPGNEGTGGTGGGGGGGDNDVGYGRLLDSKAAATIPPYGTPPVFKNHTSSVLWTADGADGYSAASLPGFFTANDELAGPGSPGTDASLLNDPTLLAAIGRLPDGKTPLGVQLDFILGLTPLGVASVVPRAAGAGPSWCDQVLEGRRQKRPDWDRPENAPFVRRSKLAIKSK